MRSEEAVSKGVKLINAAVCKAKVAKSCWAWYLAFHSHRSAFLFSVNGLELSSQNLLWFFFFRFTCAFWNWIFSTLWHLPFLWPFSLWHPLTREQCGSHWWLSCFTCLKSYTVRFNLASIELVSNWNLIFFQVASAGCAWWFICLHLQLQANTTRVTELGHLLWKANIQGRGVAQGGMVINPSTSNVGSMQVFLFCCLPNDKRRETSTTWSALSKLTVCVHANSHQTCPTPVDLSPPGSLSSHPGIEPHISLLLLEFAIDSLPLPTRSPFTESLS